MNKKTDAGCLGKPRKVLTPVTPDDVRVVPIADGVAARHTHLRANPSDRKDFLALGRVGADMVKSYLMGGLIADAFYELFLRRHGRYLEECADLAELAEIDQPIICLLQRLYSWSKLASTKPTPPVSGCSAACHYHPGQGMFLARCLDWSKPEGVLGNATRIVEYQQAGRTVYKAVQILGMTGHLSILKPGCFAIVINWAPEHGIPGLDLDPTHRLREIAEDVAIDSYDKAVAAITSHQHDIGADAFFTVAGTKPEEMCVVERKGSSNTSWIRKPAASKHILVQTNHYDPAGEIGIHLRDELKPALPEGEDGYCLGTADTTLVRQKALTDALATLSGESDMWDALHTCLNIVPVLNNDTRQQMVMHIASGEIRAWREVTPAPQHAHLTLTGPATGATAAP